MFSKSNNKWLRKEIDEAVAGAGNDETDLDEQDNFLFNTEFRCELYKKGKRRMITHELRKQMKKESKDRHNERENKVYQWKEEKKEKIYHEELDRTMEKKRVEEKLHYEMTTSLNTRLSNESGMEYL